MAIDASSDFVIPTIDIAPYVANPASAAAAQVIADVRHACMTTGFFSLVGHDVPAELQQRVLQAARLLFALPLEAKLALRPAGILKSRGYELIGSQALQPETLPDMKEGYYVGRHVPADDPCVSLHPHFVGENIFPPTSVIASADLREPLEEYHAAALSLSRTVLDILARGLPYGDDVFAEFTSNDPLCSVRMLHYPPTNESPTSASPKQLGAGAHTDFGAITLLYQDDKGGLEVLDQATDTWVPVVPNPAAYIVNVGDMLSLWTRGAYRSNLHRVINYSGTDRYSLPFFFDGNLDTKLIPLGTEDEPAGDVLTVQDHMLERLGTTFERAERQKQTVTASV
ncbi:2og-Fe oxygenase family protein [Grosmannia clavigera kw1407]|uniref:2og-Fe oxygenase family protein n=1 Tax=Grosmannia clavigera (strain kw1407 / UAMH 11150) TaxID=655863 RepID=F0XMM1_GROCL|nr:2og-Fe oxygenase family protein [Grosmannia clavigera kw1407]EFX01331.1 2og-Fe oxygenase family protein [Grosmannia clavigera kw1407]